MTLFILQLYEKSRFRNFKKPDKALLLEYEIDVG